MLRNCSAYFTPLASVNKLVTSVKNSGNYVNYDRKKFYKTDIGCLTTAAPSLVMMNEPPCTNGEDKVIN